MHAISLVYAGMTNHDGHLLHVYYRFKEGLNPELVGDDASVYMQPLGDFPVGGMVRFQSLDAEGHRIVKDGAVYLGVWPNQKLVDQWLATNASHKASEMAYAKQLGNNEFACAAPIREAYHRLAEPERTMLVVQLIRWIVEET